MIAATPTITVRDVPVHSARMLAGSLPSFNMVAFHWRGNGSVQFRVRVGRAWTAWQTADSDNRVERGWHLGNIVWVGRASALQSRVRGAIGRLRSYTVDSPVEPTPTRRLQLANAPPIIPRLSWGADESIRRAAPEYAPALKLAIVHHTAGTNTYTAAQSAAIVRGIEIYHVKGNGWNDIGYNFLVDKYGQVFEGRYGGIDRNVIGAHVEGFNTGSVGVALIGQYSSAQITPAAASALEQLLAWRLDVAHIDPLSTLTYTSGGNSRYPAGTPVTMRAISGHRDGYFTDCPGNALYAQLPAIAKAVAALGGPKIYTPLAAKLDETHTRITARLSVAQPWTVTVTNSAGIQVAQGTGTGTAVDWTWDATLAPPDKYTWTVATANARPASGTVGATTALTLQKVTASPSAVRAGDTLTVNYTLTAPATVTLALVNGAGQTLTTLLTTPKPAGAQTFAFTPPSGFYNGQYSIVITATAGGKAVTASAPFTMDDILAAFSVSPTSATLTLTRPATLVTLQIGTIVAPPVAASAGQQTVTWSPLPDGTYSATLTITDDVGTFSRVLPLVVDTTPPRVTVVSYKNLRFRVSEPARLTLVVGTSRYTRVLKRPGTTQFWLKVKPPRYALLATDAHGNTATIRYRR